MMLADGQTVSPTEVEHWVRQRFPFPHYLARVTRKDEPEHSRIRVTMEITGPRGERIEWDGKVARYFALEPMVGMAQIDSDRWGV